MTTSQVLNKCVAIPNMKTWHLALAIIGTLMTALTIALTVSFKVVDILEEDLHQYIENSIARQDHLNNELIRRLTKFDEDLERARDRHSADFNLVQERLYQHDTRNEHSGAAIRLKIIEDDVNDLKSNDK